MQEVKDTTNEARTAIFLSERQVVFMTAQKLVNALMYGCIRISDLNMLIFDECHHATEDHPYNKIMEIYHKEKLTSHKMPMIIGLTASLGVGRVNDAAKNLAKLCCNLDFSNVAHLNKKKDLDELNVSAFR